MTPIERFLEDKLADLETLHPHEEWTAGYTQALRDLKNLVGYKRAFGLWDRVEDLVWPIAEAVDDAWDTPWVRGIMGVVGGSVLTLAIVHVL